ncbi:hypothetical protein Agub_g586 [Astrephomene gubernaculifera]|uniref:Transcription factor CBF/NF-Y/archaeal histone domain-containing protein n=1 Tax=Astrephomene gubernaculifera TaxID=47775 RepID=A0AAD3DEA8_9CHLO|nr:hypothetical protein Agub_g586 [Astrephomene gubernaculifera]
MAEGGSQLPFPAGFPGQFPAGLAAAYGAQQPNNHQAEQLKAFWQSQLVEVSEVPRDPAVFKNHQLPLARIKKIMKSDEDVRMISAEAPVLFAKACEMFILELTLRSWMHAEENKRRTLQRTDVAAAITKTDIFDFLVDIVPREDIKQEEGQAAAAPPQQQLAQQAAAAVPAAAGPRAPAPAGAPVPPHPALGPASLFFPPPFPMPPGMLGGDPSQAAAAAAAAAAMMRPPMPPLGLDPALVSLYQQQLLAGQAWPHIPGLPPPPTAPGAAAAAAAAQVQQQQAAAVAAAGAMQAAAAAAAAAASTASGGHQGQGSGSAAGAGAGAGQQQGAQAAAGGHGEEQEAEEPPAADGEEE